MTWGSLWTYYRDEMSDDANENNDSGKTTASKYFEYKTKIIRNTLADNSKILE